MAGLARLGVGAQRGSDEVFILQRGVHGHAVIFILRGYGAAADQVAGFVAGGVYGDAFPERVQDHDVAEIDVGAGAAEFKHFTAIGFVDGKIEDLVAVVAEVFAGDFASLKAIGADEFAGLKICDHQVVAENVERIDVEALAVGSGEAFAEFFIEDGVTQALASDEMLWSLSESDSEQGSFG